MKKIILISTILISIFSIGLIYNKQDIKKDIVVSKEEDNIGLPMALMVETDIDTNVYESWNSDDWPGAGYTFNQEKSKCENGGTLEWTGSSVLLKTNISDKCYAYFDAPLKISTIEDLVDFSSSVNNGKTYENEYVVLMDNLDFKNASSYKNNDVNQSLITGNGFTPIGFDGKYFSGTFEGNNKEIDNLHISYNKENVYLALFGYVKNGYIKDLTVGGEVTTEIASPLGGIVNRLENSIMENCTNEVIVTSNFDTYAVGGLVSWISGTEVNNSYIKNCVNKGIVSGGDYIGGILGGHQAGNLIIENSTNKGKIESSNSRNIGGIIGIILSSAKNLTIENSNNYGEIINNNINNVSQNIGGLVGDNITANLIINSSNNYGSIKINRKNFDSFISISVGGLIGINQTNSDELIVKIDNSSNQGTITGGTYAGGLVGNSIGILNIDNSKNIGNIESITESEINLILGGLVGYSTKNLTITNSFNHGSVYAGKTTNQSDSYNKWLEINLGGIVGKIQNTKTGEPITVLILNSYNEGNITGGMRLGGLIGYNYGNVYTILNKCYNKGIIDNSKVILPDPSIATTGGIVGFNNGAPTTLNDYIAALYILNSFNANNVIGIGLVSGVTGASNNSVKDIIVNSYNLGNISNSNNLYNITESFGNYSKYKSDSELYLNNIYNAVLIENNNYNIAKILAMSVLNISNAYYINTSSNGTNLSNDSSLTTPLASNIMKNQTAMISNKYFYQVLNDNLSSINLQEIDPLLDGYTLSKWVKGEDGYPIFDYQQ